MTGFDVVTRWLSDSVVTARRSMFIRNSAGVGVLTGAELVFGLVAAILLARALGAEGLGIYSIVMAAVVLAGIPVEFGLPNLVMREVAHHDVGPGTGQMKGVLIFAVAVITLMSALIIPLALVCGDSLVPGFESREHPILPVAVWLIPLSALGKMVGSALAGKQMVVLGMMPQRLVRPVVFAVALGVVSIVEPGWLTPARAMALQLISAMAALAVGLFYFARYFSDVMKSSRAIIPWRAWGVATLRIGITNGIRLAQGQVLLLLTGALASADHAGLLRIAQRGAELVSLGTSIAIAAASPQFSRLNAEGRRDGLQRLLTQVARASTVIALLVLVCFIIGGEWLLDTFFGAGFLPAWNALIILAVTGTMRALTGPVAMLMIMLRHEGATVLGYVISLVLSASAAAVLLPDYGADGTAWGLFIGTTAMSLFLWWKARVKLGLDTAVIRLP